VRTRCADSRFGGLRNHLGFPFFVRATDCAAGNQRVAGGASSKFSALDLGHQFFCHRIEIDDFHHRYDCALLVELGVKANSLLRDKKRLMQDAGFNEEPW
jgi:hypothetical protein